MSASGMSSNRRHEEHRGYHHGTGHGPYAAAGKRRYRNEQTALHRQGAPHNIHRCPECARTRGAFRKDEPIIGRAGAAAVIYPLAWALRLVDAIRNGRSDR